MLMLNSNTHINCDALKDLYIFCVYIISVRTNLIGRSECTVHSDWFILQNIEKNDILRKSL